MAPARAAFDVGGPASGSIGTLVGINSPALTEMVSALGFDFLFLDLEHGGIGDSDLLNHVYASRVPTLVRIRDGSESAIKRAVDTGVGGIVVPHVRSASMAGDIVRWSTYPPAGRRSVGLSPNTLLGYDLAAALEKSDQPVAIAQIEDADGVAEIDGICQTRGISGVFIGPYDLSASVGVPSDFLASAFRSALSSVVDAAHRAGLLVGVFAPSVASWRAFSEQGCDYVVLRSDSLFLADGALAALSEVKARPTR